MITSLNNLYNLVASEVAEEQLNKPIAEVEKELLASTYLEVVEGEVQFVSILAENPIILKDIEDKELLDFLINVNVKLPKFIIFEKNRDGFQEKWSINGLDNYLDNYSDFIEQVKRLQEAVKANLIETVIVVVEKGTLKDLEGFKEQLGSLSIIEI